MKIKHIAFRFVPPIFWDVARRLRNTGKGRPEWEYLAEGWKTRDENIKGWNVQAIVETQKSKWDEFVRAVRSRGPLGIAHEATALSTNDLASHNGVMAFGYVLALTAREKSQISLLDWGGGIGHYYEFSKALLPEVEIDYFCKDMPLLCQAGRERSPEVRFLEDDALCFQRNYDLVMASTSLHYAEDWQALLDQLGRCATRYLYIAHLPVVPKAPSFVFVQRPYAYGYDTEYISWCFNRTEFLNFAAASGLKLVREFVYGYAPLIINAPEQNEYRGYLFLTANSKGDAP